MIDVKQPLRTSYYQLLNNHLVFNGNNVPVSENVTKKLESAEVYVIMGLQGGQSENTQDAFFSEETMQLSIVSRGTRVAKSTVDYVASQIFMLIWPSPNGNALPAQPGVSIINCRVTDDRDMAWVEAGGLNVVRRLITITQFIGQGGVTYPLPNIPANFQSPIFGTDFTNATDYVNSILTYLDYDIFLNDASTYLLFGTDWEKLPGGGFRILIPGFDSSVLPVITIYINLR